ncbi:tannase and feruloyl esterase [Phyllosticta paracitricarpa]
MWRSSRLAVLPATATLSLLFFLISPVKVACLTETQGKCGQLQARASQGLANFHITNTSIAEVGAVDDVEIPFCRLFGQISYGTNDSLAVEVWMPEANIWNNRFLTVGNGGFAGVIDTASMAEYLNQGFAVAGGDSGHLAAENNDGGGAPNTYLPYMHDKDQVKAWIHDSIALLTPVAKQLVQTYYDEPAKYSYFAGCSTGGGQGFALSQRHPELFDGIYAGSPGNWYSHLMLSFLWNAQKTKGDAYLSQDLLNHITSKVIEACDLDDGAADQLVQNPLSCKFDIDTLACEPGAPNSTTCLSDVQLQAAKAIYAGPKDARDGAVVYPGFTLGSEAVWAEGQEGALADSYATALLQNLVFNNLNWSTDSFNWASDIDKVDEFAGLLIDSTSTDLVSFKERGGKMIVSQGWADPYNAPTLPIDYLNALGERFGGDVSDFFTVFMVPGGGHCGSASYYDSVPANYHGVDALVEWVEYGVKPQSIVSDEPSDGSNRTSKLCPWPKIAKFVGNDTDSADSYDCQLEKNRLGRNFQA